MTKANPLPRKYAAIVEQTQANLRLMAHKAGALLEQGRGDPQLPLHVQSALRDLETLAYRTALELWEIEVAGGCDGCPSAPPMTQVHAHLLVLADALERHAAAARHVATASGEEY